MGAEDWRFVFFVGVVPLAAYTVLVLGWVLWIAVRPELKWRGSRDVAKDRLRLVLADDRAATRGEWLEVQHELIAVFTFDGLRHYPGRPTRLRWRYAA